MEPVRISPRKAREKVQSGSLLVCGYADDAKCSSMLLEGAITFGEFEKRLPSLPKDQNVIFYCG